MLELKLNHVSKRATGVHLVIPQIQFLSSKGLTSALLNT